MTIDDDYDEWQNGNYTNRSTDIHIDIWTKQSSNDHHWTQFRNISHKVKQRFYYIVYCDSASSKLFAGEVQIQRYWWRIFSFWNKQHHSFFDCSFSITSNIINCKWQLRERHFYLFEIRRNKKNSITILRFKRRFYLI